MSGLFFYLVFIARHTFSGVIGLSSTLTPTASSAALPTVGGDGVGVGVDAADDVDFVRRYLSPKNVRENLRIIFAISMASFASSISGRSPE